MYRMTAQLLALVAIAATVAFVVAKWASLPERVPVHFNVFGAADGWGPKAVLLMLPAVSVGIYVLFLFLERIPSRHNYPVAVTPENRAALYSLSVDLLVSVKAVVTLGLFYITWMSFRTAEDAAHGLGVGFLPIFVLAILVTIGYFLRRMKRLGS